MSSSQTDSQTNSTQLILFPNPLKIWTVGFMQKAELHQMQETAVWTLCSKCRLFFQRDLTLTALPNMIQTSGSDSGDTFFLLFPLRCSFPIHRTILPRPSEPHTFSRPEIGISDDSRWRLWGGCWHFRVGFKLFAKSCQTWSNLPQMESHISQYYS